MYLASDTTIPEVILQALNEMIRGEFPGKECRFGFYHKIVLRKRMYPRLNG
ncbi:MAG: hypothetical protein ACLTZT_01040 [Butyricimonas faecalis]